MRVFLVCECCPLQPLQIITDNGKTRFRHKDYSVELPIGYDKVAFGFESYVNSNSLSYGLTEDALDFMQIVFVDNKYTKTLKTIKEFLDEHKMCVYHRLEVR